MKKLMATAFGLLAVGSASAATNLIVIGHADTPSPLGHFFNHYGIPWKVYLVPLIVFAIGIFHFFCPRACWYFKWGWRFADSEPSNLWLFFERAGGILIMGFAIFLLLAFSGIIQLPNSNHH